MDTQAHICLKCGSIFDSANHQQVTYHAKKTCLYDIAAKKVKADLSRRVGENPTWMLANKPIAAN